MDLLYFVAMFFLDAAWPWWIAGIVAVILGLEKLHLPSVGQIGGPDTAVMPSAIYLLYGAALFFLGADWYWWVFGAIVWVIANWGGLAARLR